jgi:large subunit ribosomal protein L7/L12
MSTTVEQIIDQLKTLTLIESSELVTQIEQTFGVDASASVGVAMPTMDQNGGEDGCRKTTFDVMVEAIVSDKRVAVLKVIRKLTSLGLAKQKNLQLHYQSFKEGVSKDEAEETKSVRRSRCYCNN